MLLDLVISRLIPKFKLDEVELRAAVYKLYKLKGGFTRTGIGRSEREKLEDHKLLVFKIVVGHVTVFAVGSFLINIYSTLGLG